MIIIVFIVSMIPVMLLYFWLRNRLKQDDITYRKLCDKTLLSGVLSVFPIILCSGISYVVLRLTRIQDVNPLLYQCLYTFIVLAFSEELMKFMAFRRVLKKNEYSYSWLDMVALMTIVGIGFDIIESMVYLIGASVPVVIVRGICVPHAGYGALMGYFYGKSVKTGKKSDKIIGFLIPWLIHGMYDFSLSDEFAALNENLRIIALLLALVEIALVIWLVVFARKARKQEKYTVPLLVNKPETSASAE